MARLSPQELAEFRSWFNRFDAEAWIGSLKKTLSAGDSTHWQMKRSRISTLDAAQICEAPRQPKILAVLQCTA